MRKSLFLLMICTSIACSSTPAGAPQPKIVPATQRIRDRLGIPPDAKKVVIFAQNAHLDIDWQKTFDGYYTAFVEQILMEARKLLEAQPRAYYSVAEMAYLQHHLAVHPEEVAPLKKLIAQGRFRIVGGGMTSPDTLLPETELLARDFLHGLIFAESLGAHPTAAWLPDSFGHGATAPDILAAAGYASVAFSRVDGAPTIFESMANPDQGSKPGSTAEWADKQGSWDFWWTGPGGGKVLAHYMGALGLYCQGDNIDYEEPIQVPGGHMGSYHGDDPAFTDAKIQLYLDQLQPRVKTPYFFVPVGCDFQHPKENLVAYLDGWNKRQYAKTGVWAVSAPFEDYADLVRDSGVVLPELSGELSPYFMGFYGTRGELKRRVRDAARPLLAAETFATLQADGGKATMQQLAPLWRELARTNHHDFVTGTANDMVVAGEQLPLCDAVTATAAPILAAVLADVAGRVAPVPGSLCRVVLLNASGVPQPGVATGPSGCPASIGPTTAHAVSAGESLPLAKGTPWSVRVSAVPAFGWRVVDIVPGAMDPLPTVSFEWIDDDGVAAYQHASSRLRLQNAHVRAEVQRMDGESWLSSLLLDGQEVLSGPSFLLRTYDDQGGLWRLGNEMVDCAMTPTPTAPEVEQLYVTGLPGGGLSLRFGSEATMRSISLQPDDHGPTLRVVTSPPSGTSQSATFSFAETAAPLLTGQAAGMVTRPLVKVYSPTWWPAVDWLTVGQTGILLQQATGVRMSQGGQLELMAARNAPSEQCDIEGGKGTDDGAHTVTWRILPAAAAVDAAQAAQAFNRPVLQVPGATAVAKPELPPQGSLASLEGPGVLTALKPADRGAGVIVRALLLPGPCKLHLDPRFSGKTLTLVDAAERDVKPLGKATATIVLDREHFGAIVTLRVH